MDGNGEVSKLQKEAVLSYIADQRYHNSVPVGFFSKYGTSIDTRREIIRDLIKDHGEKITKTVYRGQEQNNLPNKIWFSCSNSLNLALNNFTGRTCCLFIIHLDDVPVYDIYANCENHGLCEVEVPPIYKFGDWAFEEEVLVLGGGYFYKNKELNEKGYTQIEDTIKPIPGLPAHSINTYECWYSMVDHEETNISGGRIKRKRKRTKKANKNKKKRNKSRRRRSI